MASRRALNAEFTVPAAQEGSALVPFIANDLAEILCEHFERVVRNDNCVGFEGLVLQIPANCHRCHYVKLKVRVHRYRKRTLGPVSWPALPGQLRCRMQGAQTHGQSPWGRSASLGRAGQTASGSALRDLASATPEADN